MCAGLTSPPRATGIVGAVGCAPMLARFVPSELSPVGTPSPLSSIVGSTMLFAKALWERPTFGLAKRTLPREGFFACGSMTSIEVSDAVMISAELALGMRSVIDADCTLPCFGEEITSGPEGVTLGLGDVATPKF